MIQRHNEGIKALFIALLIMTATLTLPHVLKVQLLVELILLAGILVFTRIKRIEIVPYCHIKRVRLKGLPILLPLTVLLIIAAGYVNACSEIFFSNRITSTLNMAGGHLPASVVIFCVLPAITEELIFRGLILRRIKNVKTGIVVSALLFALWHLNPNQMSYALLAGILLGLLAVYTDNLICSMLTHFLFNLYNLLMMRVSSESMIGRVIAAIRMGSYHLFTPEIQAADGSLLTGNLLWGLLAAVMSISLYMLILVIIKHHPDREHQEL